MARTTNIEELEGGEPGKDSKASGVDWSSMASNISMHGKSPVVFVLILVLWRPMTLMT